MFWGNHPWQVSCQVLHYFVEPDQIRKEDETTLRIGWGTSITALLWSLSNWARFRISSHKSCPVIVKTAAQDGGDGRAWQLQDGLRWTRTNTRTNGQTHTDTLPLSFPPRQSDPKGSNYYPCLSQGNCDRKNVARCRQRNDYEREITRVYSADQISKSNRRLKTAYRYVYIIIFEHT